LDPITATFETPHAARYLQQLCKHFAHKVPAEWSEGHGTVSFMQGGCSLDADAGALRITCTPKSAEAAPMLLKLVAVHLERFAFREAPDLQWQQNGQPALALTEAVRNMADPHKPGED
jgi:hypothetical protein